MKHLNEAQLNEIEEAAVGDVYVMMSEATVSDFMDQRSAMRTVARRFFRRQKHKPFASETTAVMSLGPIAVYLIGWGFRHLAFAFIRALWRRWNST